MTSSLVFNILPGFDIVENFLGVLQWILDLTLKCSYGIENKMDWVKKCNIAKLINGVFETFHKRLSEIHHVVSFFR